MSSVTLPVSSENIVQPQSCCDRVVQALGRCWTWIVDSCRWLMDRVFQGVNAVAFGFFRVVDCFAPKWARKMETGYLYLANWYAGHKAAVAKQIADTTIADLKEMGSKTTKELAQTAGDLAALKVRHGVVKRDRKRLEKERDGDIEAVERMKSECEISRHKEVALENECDMSRNKEEVLVSRVDTLLKENERLRGKIQKTTLRRASAESAVAIKTDEMRELAISNELLTLRVETAEMQRDFALKSTEFAKYFQGLSKQQRRGACQRG